MADCTINILIKQSNLCSSLKKKKKLQSNHYYFQSNELKPSNKFWVDMLSSTTAKILGRFCTTAKILEGILNSMH